MGNCLVLQEKPIKVMKTDGELLEYRAPMKVHQLLSQYSSCHAISKTFPVIQHLRAETDMLSGHLYYLLPLPVPSPDFDNQKNLRYSNPKEITGDQKNSGSVVRIKLVISKQELELMLRKGGVLSVSEMVSELHNKQSANAVDYKTDYSDGNGSCKGWKPVLQSIPEIN